MDSRTRRRVRWAGLALGLALAAALLVGWRVPGGDGVAGVRVALDVLGPGELSAAPVHAVLAADLRAGEEVASRARLRNQSGRPVRVSARALPSIADLDALMTVRIAAGGGELYAGPLGGLRTPAGAARLAPGHETTLDVRVALAESARERCAGRVLDLVLELAAAPEAAP